MTKRLLLALMVIVSSTACMRVSTLITLKQDGSGTIDQEIGVNPQAFEGLAAMAGGGRGGAEGGFQDVFNEAKAREEAGKMGVRFVSGAQIDTPTLKGYHAKYAFDDVKALKVRMAEAAAEKGDKGRDPFDFDFTKGGSSSTITIRIPQESQQPPMARLGAGGDPAQAQQMLAMMKPMFAGMFVEIALAVDGQIVKTNAPFVQGSKVTLVQLDMDTLLANDSAWTKLQNAKTPAELKNIPGLKVTSEPTVTIEFRR
jgi:hypothetical protein